MPIVDAKKIRAPSSEEEMPGEKSKVSRKKLCGTAYFAPNVKMNPAEARMLFWFSLLPASRLGKRVST